MQNLLSRCLLALTFTTIFLSCGNGPLAPPPPSDPSFGTAGNILVRDGPYDHDGQQNFLWIGFSTAQGWQSLLEHAAVKKQFIIGGKVVATSNNALGFYVDPSSSVAADGGYPECFTNFDAIKKNVPLYADPRNPGWCIQIEFVRAE